MDSTVSEAGQYASHWREYEREDTVNSWLQCYEIEKERYLIACLDRFVPRERVILLGIGAGKVLICRRGTERE